MHIHQTLNNLRFTALWLFITALLLTACGTEQAASSSSKKKKNAYNTLTIQPQAADTFSVYDGTIEAVRQTNIAAQVIGEVTELNVVVGDQVKKNQLLMRLDAQAAHQTALASSSQLTAARAQLNLAQQEYSRQKQLYAKQYISQGALDNAKAVYQSAKAQVDAQIAQTGVATSQTGFHLIKAPYDAIIAEAPVTLGDMATPGKTLLTLYDASQLRASVAIPQSIALAMEMQTTKAATVMMNDNRKVEVANIQILPAADQTTHTRTVRLNLAKDLTNIAPGMHVKVNFSVNQPATDLKIIVIPMTALVKHAEMTGVYVISQSGEPLLRQLRLGETHGDQVEVLSGLSAGEKIAIEPQTIMGTL